MEIYSLKRKGQQITKAVIILWLIIWIVFSIFLIVRSISNGDEITAILKNAVLLILVIVITDFAYYYWGFGMEKIELKEGTLRLVKMRLLWKNAKVFQADKILEVSCADSYRNKLDKCPENAHILIRLSGNVVTTRGKFRKKDIEELISQIENRSS